MGWSPKKNAPHKIGYCPKEALRQLTIRRQDALLNLFATDYTDGRSFRKRKSSEDIARIDKKRERWRKTVKDCDTKMKKMQKTIGGDGNE